VACATARVCAGARGLQAVSDVVLPHSNKNRLKLAAAIAVAIGAPCMWAFIGASLVPRFQHVVQELGGWAELGFGALAALAIALCAPASLIYLTGGMVFGVLRGLLLGCAAGALGSAAAFWIARTALGARAARMLSRSARLDRFERALSERPLWLTMLLRLSLFIPIGPLSYALGLSRVPTRTFLATSWALAPAVLTYAYAGDVAREALGAGQRAREPWEWALLALGLVATAGAAILIGRAAARALSRDAGDSAGGDRAHSSTAERPATRPSTPHWLSPTPGDGR